MLQATTPSASSGTDTDAMLYVLYGTETGNSQSLASSASAAAERAGLHARVLGLDQISARELVKVRHAIFIVSTTGDGEMPYTAAHFWDALSADDFPQIKQLRYGVLALGDTAYDEFCAAGVALDKRLTMCGAVRLVERGDCDHDFEATAVAWLDHTIEAFAQSIHADGPAGNEVGVVFSLKESGRPRHSAWIHDLDADLAVGPLVFHASQFRQLLP